MRPQIPSVAERYHRTKTFTAENTPASLRHEHRTAADVWGELVVEQGEVLYEETAGARRSQRVTPDVPAVIEPGVAHRVTPSADAKFHLEFYRMSSRDGRKAAKNRSAH